MDYKQTEGSATKWRRASQIHIDNSRNAIPRIFFHEEDVLVLGTDEYHTPVGSPVVGVFDPAGEIPLYNPLDGTPLGVSSTQQEFMVILYSLYMQLALQRDADEAAAG